MLLDHTRDVLVLGCSTPANYNNSIFALLITENTSAEMVLTALCTQGNPALPDAAMFQRALREGGQYLSDNGRCWDYVCGSLCNALCRAYNVVLAPAEDFRRRLWGERCGEALLE